MELRYATWLFVTLSGASIEMRQSLPRTDFRCKCGTNSNRYQRIGRLIRFASDHKLTPNAKVAGWTPARATIYIFLTISNLSNLIDSIDALFRKRDTSRKAITHSWKRCERS
jgi:hypothetical protein